MEPPLADGRETGVDCRKTRGDDMTCSPAFRSPLSVEDVRDPRMDISIGVGRRLGI
jgi:hypothetical protein